MKLSDLTNAHLREKGVFITSIGIFAVIWGLLAPDPAVLGMSVALFYLGICLFALRNQIVKGRLIAFLFVWGLAASIVVPMILTAKFAS